MLSLLGGAQNAEMGADGGASKVDAIAAAVAALAGAPVPSSNGGRAGDGHDRGASVSVKDLAQVFNKVCCVLRACVCVWQGLRSGVRRPCVPQKSCNR
jgi:hypothetical protein